MELGTTICIKAARSRLFTTLRKALEKGPRALSAAAFVSAPKLKDDDWLERDLIE
jgi:hypothetical protein